jgi:hypothetical protein
MKKGLAAIATSPCYFRSAEGGSRTHTPVRALDFESSASANSATSASNACRHNLPYEASHVNRVRRPFLMRSFRAATPGQVSTVRTVARAKTANKQHRPSAAAPAIPHLPFRFAFATKPSKPGYLQVRTVASAKTANVTHRPSAGNISKRFPLVGSLDGTAFLSDNRPPSLTWLYKNFT